jgi:hypothetical protein
MTNGTISSTTDGDYFTFTTTANAPNVSIVLSQLGADFDVILYNANQSSIGSSAFSSTRSEFIEFATTAAGTYYIYVYGYNGATSPNCYLLTVLADGSTPYCLTASDENQKATNPANLLSRNNNLPKSGVLGLSLYPNPASSNVNLQVSAPQTAYYDVHFYDILGKVVISQKLSLTQGSNQVNIPTNSLAKGFYTVRVFNGKESVTQKLSIH